MEDMSLRNYAYIGDAVWELFIREKTTRLTSNAKELHKITTNNVKASFQAELLHDMEDILTCEEKDIARRARNLPIPIARRQIQTAYRQATAFEALVGFWHMHDNERLNCIFNRLEDKLLITKS